MLIQTGANSMINGQADIYHIESKGLHISAWQCMIDSKHELQVQSCVLTNNQSSPAGYETIGA